MRTPDLSDRHDRTVARNRLVALLAIALILLGVGAQAVIAFEPVPTASGDERIRAVFRKCEYRPQLNCVFDGDTIRIAGEHIRLANVDAPEHGGAACARERVLGVRAATRLRTLLSAGTISLEAPLGPDTDAAGRKLRLVRVEQRDVGRILVKEELARWSSGEKRTWC